MLTSKLLKVGDFSLSVEFFSKRENFLWQCTSVYGPNARALKHAFWEELRNCTGFKYSLDYMWRLQRNF